MLAGAIFSIGACGRQRREPARSRLPIHVLADTAGSVSLRVGPPPRARAFLSRVSPAPPAGAAPALPEAAPDTQIAPSEPRTIEVDPGLEPPILKRPAALMVPDSWRRRHGARTEAVELDVLVEESGEVAEAQWAGGSRDSSLIEAATSCARSMSFYPALRGGWPVAVWCRQRFDFGPK